MSSQLKAGGGSDIWFSFFLILLFSSLLLYIGLTFNISQQQLQRIVSRCKCEFYYVAYGETGLDVSLLEEVHPPLPEDDLWSRNVEAVDTFTLVHHDLCASTNSLQVCIFKQIDIEM